MELSLEQLRSRQNAKWGVHPAPVIPAWVADMDFAVAPPIQRALERLTHEQDYGYGLRNGAKADPSVAQAYARYMQSQHGWTVDADLVQPIAELVQATFALLWAFSDEGDGVILNTPAYPPMREAILETGRTLYDSPMRLDTHGYVIDFEHLDSLPKGSVYMLCNPHNPCGRVLTRAELERLAEYVIARDLIVIADEIHSDLVYPGHTHIPFASLGDAVAARTITITSATKGFNLPGLRAAVMHFGTADLQQRFYRRVPKRMLGQLSLSGIDATVAAWSEESQPWLRDLRANLLARRDQLTQFLAERLPKVGYVVPESTYLAWLDFSAYGLGESATAFLLREAQVGLSPGESFGPDPAFTRLNFATSETILREILERIERALQGR